MIDALNPVPLAMLCLALVLTPASAAAGDEALGWLAVGIVAVPAAGVEVQSEEGHSRRERLLLSWPTQVALRGWDSPDYFEATHRIVVSPELRLGGGAELGGRVGYRWARNFMGGLGISFSRGPGWCASPEFGVRPLFNPGIPGPFILLRADLPVTSAHVRAWAASASVGFSLY